MLGRLRSGTDILPALALTLALPLGSVHARGTPPQFTSNPVIVPNPNSCAATNNADGCVFGYAEIACQTDIPTHLWLIIDDGLEVWDVRASAVQTTDHVVPLMEIGPNRQVSIEVVAIDSQGNASFSPGGPLLYQADPLPDIFFDFSADVYQPAMLARGVRQGGVILATMRSSRDVHTWIACFGGFEGRETIWGYKSGEYISHAIPRNGKILLDDERNNLQEIDLAGNTLRTWHAVDVDTTLPPGAIPIATDSIHHEFEVLPSGLSGGLGGDVLLISSELRHYPDYPADPLDLNVTVPRGLSVGDTIVEVDLDTGAVVSEWSMHDLVDPYRISHGHAAQFWTDIYQPLFPNVTNLVTYDWTHGNSVDFLECNGEGNIAVSLRNQDATICFSRDTGKLLWILGDPTSWAPPYDQLVLSPATPTDEPPYHQHDIELVECVAGKLIVSLFDNGCQRSIAPDPGMPPYLRYSRFVQYEIDPTAMTYRTLFEHGPSDPRDVDHFYSSIVSGGMEIQATDQRTRYLIVSGAEKDPNRLGSARIRVVLGNGAIIREYVLIDNSPIPRSLNAFQGTWMPTTYLHLFSHGPQN